MVRKEVCVCVLGDVSAEWVSILKLKLQTITRTRNTIETDTPCENSVAQCSTGGHQTPQIIAQQLEPMATRSARENRTKLTLSIGITLTLKRQSSGLVGQRFNWRWHKRAHFRQQTKQRDGNSLLNRSIAYPILTRIAYKGALSLPTSGEPTPD